MKSLVRLLCRWRFLPRKQERKPVDVANLFKTRGWGKIKTPTTVAAVLVGVDRRLS